MFFIPLMDYYNREGQDKVLQAFWEYDRTLILIFDLLELNLHRRDLDSWHLSKIARERFHLFLRTAHIQEYQPLLVAPLVNPKTHTDDTAVCGELLLDGWRATKPIVQHKGHYRVALLHCGNLLIVFGPVSVVVSHQAVNRRGWSVSTTGPPLPTTTVSSTLTPQGPVYSPQFAPQISAL